MAELSGKTVAELRELAREREVASRTEINRARQAPLLEWLEAPNEESPANVEEDQQVQGELFPTPPGVETVQEEKEEQTESEKAPPQEPPVQASLEDEAQKEGAWDTMPLILVGLAVVALLIYLFR